VLCASLANRNLLAPLHIYAHRGASVGRACWPARRRGDGLANADPAQPAAAHVCRCALAENLREVESYVLLKSPEWRRLLPAVSILFPTQADICRTSSCLSVPLQHALDHCQQPLLLHVRSAPPNAAAILEPSHSGAQTVRGQWCVRAWLSGNH
jgi:hypothetical protein